jgi:hypothetical protein
VDEDLIRRTWPEIVKQLDVPGSKTLHAAAQYVLTSQLAGDTLELILPPGKKFAADKIEGKQDALREVLQRVLGISPPIRCVVRDGVAVPEPSLDDDEPAPTPEQALERAVESFGAEVVED